MSNFCLEQGQDLKALGGTPLPDIPVGPPAPRSVPSPWEGKGVKCMGMTRGMLKL